MAHPYHDERPVMPNRLDRIQTGHDVAELAVVESAQGGRRLSAASPAIAVTLDGEHR
jgi:hypothetical protein